MKLPPDYDAWKSRSDLDDWAAQNHREEIDGPQEELFSVCQILEGGTCEWVCLGVSAKEAVESAHHYCRSVGAQIGLVERVMITDDDDCTVFLWTRESGITFPLEAAGRR